jgi:ribose transport system ATP-binding protein
MACELARHGVRCRIVDQNPERSQTSKALGIFPRTLEVFSTMGLADRVLVLREGRIVRTAPATELDESQVLDLVMEGSAV